MMNDFMFTEASSKFEVGDKIRFKPAEEINKEFPGALWFTKEKLYLSLRDSVLTVTKTTQVGNMMFAVETDRTDTLLNERVFELVEERKDVALDEIMMLMK